MNHEQMHYIEEDKIDLRELWQVLLRRKLLIAVTTGLLTALAIAYVLIATPQYEVKSNVMVGYIGSDKEGNPIKITDPITITTNLNIVFNVEDKPAYEEPPLALVTSISTNKKIENFITIKTEGVSNEEALKKNKEVVLYLQNLYQPKLDQYIIVNKNKILQAKQKIIDVDNFEIKNITEQIKLLKTQNIAKIDEKMAFYRKVKLPSVEKKLTFYATKLKEYNRSIHKVYQKSSKSSDSIAQAVMSMQMLNYQNMVLNSQNKIEELKIEKELINNEKIIALQREKENINGETIRKLEHKINIDLVTKKRVLAETIQKYTYNISEQNIQNSKVIGEYITKDYPVKPKKTLIVVVAFITGLMLSVFLAFFLEFIQGNRKEEHA